jgi:hypothetical protein
MTVLQKTARWRRQAVVRELLIGALWSVPCAAIPCVLLWRFAGVWPALLLVGLLIALAAAWAFRMAARHDQAWLIRQLDKNRPELEDSSDLLWRPESTLNTLQHLQKQRIVSRLGQCPELDLRRPWPSAGVI